MKFSIWLLRIRGNYREKIPVCIPPQIIIKVWRIPESNRSPNNFIKEDYYMLLEVSIFKISGFVLFQKTRKLGGTLELNSQKLHPLFLWDFCCPTIKVLTAPAMLVYNLTKQMVSLRDQAAIRYSTSSSFLFCQILKVFNVTCMSSITNITCQSQIIPIIKKIKNNVISHNLKPCYHYTTSLNY